MSNLISGLISADAMHDMMEDAIREPKGNGFVDCIVHFSRMATGDYLPGDVEDIIENDLDDCTPEYVRFYRMAWLTLTGALTAITKDQS